MRRCRDSPRQPITFPLVLTPFLATEGLCTYAQAYSVWLSVASHSASHSHRRRVRTYVCMFQPSLMLCGLSDLFKYDEKCMDARCTPTYVCSSDCTRMCMCREETLAQITTGGDENNNNNVLDLCSTFRDTQTLCIEAIIHSHRSHTVLVGSYTCTSSTHTNTSLAQGHDRHG